ncbi:MAG: hypothetical protein IJI37_06880, partial [Opitutales bacterium]|nr:hypothetical protein [Opitutales bacterium]
MPHYCRTARVFPPRGCEKIWVIKIFQKISKNVLTPCHFPYFLFQDFKKGELSKKNIDMKKTASL